MIIQKQPPELFCKKKVLLKISQNLQENNCARVSFLIKLQALGFLKKETLAQAFSYEFCKIFKNTFFIEHLRTTAYNYYYYISVIFQLRLSVWFV